MYADTSVPSAVALRSFWVGLCVAEEDRLHRGSDDFKIGRFSAILTICPLFATSATRLLWIRDFGLIEIRSSRPADVTELDIINNPAASRSRHWRRRRPRALDDVDFAAIHQLVGNAVSDPIGLRQSIVVAVLIGELEALGLVGSKFGLEGKFWDFIDQANDNFGCSDIRSSVSSSQAG